MILIWFVLKILDLKINEKIFLEKFKPEYYCILNLSGFNIYLNNSVPASNDVKNGLGMLI